MRTIVLTLPGCERHRVNPLFVDLESPCERCGVLMMLVHAARDAAVAADLAMKVEVVDDER